MQNTKRMKVVSDGTTWGTKIFFDGHEVGTVTKLRIDFDVNTDLARCKMEIMVPELEMEFDDSTVEIFSKSMKKCPSCGKLKRPDIAYILGVEVPALKYTCKDCNWEESITMPLDFNVYELLDRNSREETNNDQGNT